MICKNCRAANSFDMKSKYDLKEFYKACKFLSFVNDLTYEQFLEFAQARISRLHHECIEFTHPTYCDCQHKTVPIVRDLG